jgi:putative transposase
MARRLRCSGAGHVYHVLNRAAGRATLFDKPADYAAFEKVLRQAWERTGRRLVASVAMPNHWRLVVWPSRDGELSTWAQWLTVTQVRRRHAHRHTEGTGPVYQGRFKSFPVQEDSHYLTVCRYVERNPLRANLTPRAKAWRWSSLWHRERATGAPWLCAGPLPLPEGWAEYVYGAETEAEVAALRRSVGRGAPFGEAAWQERTARALGLESALRRRGRQNKVRGSSEDLT